MVLLVDKSWYWNECIGMVIMPKQKKSLVGSLVIILL